MKTDERLFLRDYRNVIDLQKIEMVPTREDRMENCFRRLAAAMIISAFDDLADPDTKHFERMRARLFFDSGRFHMWADILGIPHDDVMRKYRRILFLTGHNGRMN